jgi:hypothetical protein
VRGTVAIEFGVLPTDPRFAELDPYTIEFLYALIERRREAMFVRFERVLGVRFTRSEVSMMSSKKRQSGPPPDEMIYPLALALSPEYMKQLKFMFGMDPNSRGYSSDAHLDSLIGGQVVRKSDGVEFIELDERYSPDQARSFFDKAHRTGKPIPNDGLIIDPASLRNTPKRGEVPFTESTAQDLAELIAARKMR